MGRRIPERLEQFLNWGAERATADTYEITYRIGFGRVLLVTVGPFFAGYAVHFYLVGLTIAACLMLIGAISIGIGIVLTALEPKVRDWAPWYYVIVMVGVLAPLVLHDVEVIWIKGRLDYVGWIFVYPSLAFFLLGSKRGFAFAGTVVILIGIGFALPYRGAASTFDPVNLRVQLILSLVASLAIAAIYERTRRVTQSRHVASEARLRTANAALEAANAEARRASNAKTEFLAQVSHELRTPLNHIVGFTQLVLDGSAGPLTDSQKEYLGDVMASSGRLLELINDMLDLTRVESGRLVLEKRAVSIGRLLEECAASSRDAALRRKITVTIHTDEDPGRIMADARRLRQIVCNLVSNSVKFTPPGGTVTIRAEERGGAAGESRIELTVADTGIGIDSADLERIFLPFEQVRPETGGKTEGTGLGLSLTRQLVEAHGGRVWAESEGRGTGSTFHVLLPRD